MFVDFQVHLYYKLAYEMWDDKNEDKYILRFRTPISTNHIEVPLQLSLNWTDHFK